MLKNDKPMKPGDKDFAQHGERSASSAWEVAKSITFQDALRRAGHPAPPSEWQSSMLFAIARGDDSHPIQSPSSSQLDALPASSRAPDPARSTGDSSTSVDSNLPFTTLLSDAEWGRQAHAERVKANMLGRDCTRPAGDEHDPRPALTQLPRRGASAPAAADSQATTRGGDGGNPHAPGTTATGEGPFERELTAYRESRTLRAASASRFAFVGRFTSQEKLDACNALIVCVHADSEGVGGVAGAPLLDRAHWPALQQGDLGKLTGKYPETYKRIKARVVLPAFTAR